MKNSLQWLAALVLGATTAEAADGSRLLGACHHAVTQTTLPAGMSAEGYLRFCECLVSKAADNQSVIDEYVGIAGAKPDELPAKLAAASSSAKAVGSACQAHPFPPEPQIEMHVPFEPTAFPSLDHTYFTYELMLTNVAATPLTLQRFEVLDAGSRTPIAAFEAAQLEAILQHFRNPTLGDTKPAATDNYRQLSSGETAVLFLMVRLDQGAKIPDRLAHRIITTDAIAEGAVIGTHHDRLRVLGPPLAGTGWRDSAGPGNNDTYHRRGLLVMGGNGSIARRYAIDWLKVKDGTSHSGDERDNHSYFAYGMDVLAVADGVISLVHDGIPENVPGHNGKGSRAVPLSIDTLAGNTIALDIGNGQFAHYDHLQPGSLRVKVGERVRAGQRLAKVGDSGDAFEPHLHFEVSTSANVVTGEGVPYVIARYRIQSAPDTGPQVRTRELPLDSMIIDFGVGR